MRVEGGPLGYDGLHVPDAPQPGKERAAAVARSHDAGKRFAALIQAGDHAGAKAALLESVAHATAHLPDDGAAAGMVQAMTAKGPQPGDSQDTPPAGTPDQEGAPSAYDKALNALLLLTHDQAWQEGQR